MLLHDIDAEISAPSQSMGTSPAPVRPDALDRVLTKSGAKSPFERMYLLVGALDAIAQGGGAAWTDLARDLAAHLLQATPEALAGGGEPGPALAGARAIMERLAKGEAVDAAGARDRVFAAITEAHRTARDHAEAVAVREETDRRRFLDRMQDSLPIAVIAAVAVTAATLKSLVSSGHAPMDRVSSLDAGLDAGLQALSAKGIQPSAGLLDLIAAARAAKASEATTVVGGRGGHER